MRLETENETGKSNGNYSRISKKVEMQPVQTAITQSVTNLWQTMQLRAIQCNAL